MTKLYLDHERATPAGWERVFTARECIERLQRGDVEVISLGHDLGPPEAGDGDEVAKWIEAQAFEGTLKRLAWAVHSANPAGRNNIEAAMNAADRFWISRPE
ncbi:MAG: hypothetical protein DI536_13370 [Archangium gephyra]|uniref:Cyclic-phosphate processing Receiver domain-containing protein n=1 Tax=Archangium gephyra TaxID=48 RepID=A0A2W5VRT5_9BACT|nr:MAG: hypothetical protein DI536_13370 [Archangium gephyra]